MIRRNQIVRLARECINTKYHHQGRLLGVGLDCVGVPIHVGTVLGYPIEDVFGYSPQPDGVTILKQMRKDFDEIGIEEKSAGDVLIFWVMDPKKPQHVGIMTDSHKIRMVHSFSTVGKVAEHDIAGTWERRLCNVFKFRGAD